MVADTHHKANKVLAWFTWLWVIQEIALVTAAPFVCGKNLLDWESFAQVFHSSKAL